jgi:hypothetical protein
VLNIVVYNSIDSFRFHTSCTIISFRVCLCSHVIWSYFLFYSFLQLVLTFKIWYENEVSFKMLQKISKINEFIYCKIIKNKIIVYQKPEHIKLWFAITTQAFFEWSKKQVNFITVFLQENIIVIKMKVHWLKKIIWIIN